MKIELTEREVVITLSGLEVARRASETQGDRALAKEFDALLDRVLNEYLSQGADTN